MLVGGGGGGYRQENKIDTSPDNRSGGVFFQTFQFGLFCTIQLNLASWREIEKSKDKSSKKRGSFLVKQKRAGYLVKKVDFQFRGSCTVLETPEMKNCHLQLYLFNWRRFIQFQDNYLAEEKVHSVSYIYYLPNFHHFCCRSASSACKCPGNAC